MLVSVFPYFPHLQLHMKQMRSSADGPFTGSIEVHACGYIPVFRDEAAPV
jgi:hypothetical protein